MKLDELNFHERDKNIQFDESSHTYTVNDTTLKSVTTWINSFFPKFDTNAIVEKMMKSPKWEKNELYGKTKEEILTIWEKNNLHAVQEGTKLHYDIELYYNDIEVKNNSIEFQYFQNFARDHYYLTPFRTEWKIYCEESGYIDSIKIDIIPFIFLLI